MIQINYICIEQMCVEYEIYWTTREIPLTPLKKKTDLSRLTKTSQRYCFWDKGTSNLSTQTQTQTQPKPKYSTHKNALHTYKSTATNNKNKTKTKWIMEKQFRSKIKNICTKQITTN